MARNARLPEAGAVVVQESLGMEAAYFAQLPAILTGARDPAPSVL